MKTSLARRIRPEARQLSDLISVGPATISDLKILGITTVGQLLDRNPKDMYDALCTLTKTRHDPCCVDVFRAAVEQAKNPDLPLEKCNWWYWSRVRKMNT